MIFKSDKLDYLGGPRKEFFFYNFFSIGPGPSNVGKLNWNLLGFFSFIISIGQCETSGPLILVTLRVVCLILHPNHFKGLGFSLHRPAFGRIYLFIFTKDYLTCGLLLQASLRSLKR